MFGDNIWTKWLSTHLHNTKWQVINSFLMLGSEFWNLNFLSMKKHLRLVTQQMWLNSHTHATLILHLERQCSRGEFSHLIYQWYLKKARRKSKVNYWEWESWQPQQNNTNNAQYLLMKYDGQLDWKKENNTRGVNQLFSIYN